MCPAIFGDGFDCYAAPADSTAGYWDSGTFAFTLVAGRFAGSMAIQNASNNAWLVKTTTGTTDNNHHISCAFQQTAAITGSTLGLYFQLSDGATNQVCIVFRSDGAILLTSATPAGTVLDTYTSAFTAASTWYQFEIEVVIHNTAGSWAVRKLGNTSNDRATGGLNTRPGANAQASKLTVGQNAAVTSHQLDDLLWRSDTSSVAWAGDIRCFTRRPASDASVQWTRSGTSYQQITNGGIQASSLTPTANQIVYIPFTAVYTGSVGSLTLTCQTTSAANWKCALYNNAGSGGSPGTVLGTATPFSAPGVGAYTINFPTPVSVTAGSVYYVGIGADAASGQFRLCTNNTTAGYTTNSGYAAFPVNNPAVTTSTGTTYYFTVNYGATGNYMMVGEAQQDAATSYNYSSNVGDSDLYGISAISSTPASVVAVTTRAYLQKSDAGTRNTSVRLRSGGVNADSTSAALNTTFGWQYLTNTTDPATGAAWTAVGVANCSIGVIVTA